MISSSSLIYPTRTSNEKNKKIGFVKSILSWYWKTNLFSFEFYSRSRSYRSMLCPTFCHYWTSNPSPPKLSNPARHIYVVLKHLLYSLNSKPSYLQDGLVELVGTCDAPFIEGIKRVLYQNKTKLCCSICVIFYWVTLCMALA
jgi:hypothetical protein